MHLRLQDLTALAVLIFSLSACEPARTNPFDPLASGAEGAAVSGSVTSFYPPFAPMADATVRLEPGGTSTRSNEQGRFFFQLVEFGQYSVMAEMDGFASRPETLRVTTAPGQELSLQLDALPSVTSATIRSSHVSRWWPEDDLFMLTIDVEMEDADGVNDIERVWVELSSMGVVDTLVTVRPGYFSLSIPERSLPVASIDELVGDVIQLFARDAAGFVAGENQLRLARVIRETPLAISPADLQTVAPVDIRLSWQPLILPFTFSYEVELVRVEANVEAIVETIRAIPSSATTTVVPTALDPGTYYWVVWVVDSFGNRSRSKQAGFTVS